MTQMENGARAGKGVHQLPAINYNLADSVWATTVSWWKKPRKRGHMLRVACEGESLTSSSELEQLRES